jgi:hypothetical protein
MKNLSFFLNLHRNKLNVRLACVKHLDSVQSEPSPNSSIIDDVGCSPTSLMHRGHKNFLFKFYDKYKLYLVN